MSCPICKSKTTEVFHQSNLTYSITSDSRSTPKIPAPIFVCLRCSHLFKEPQQVGASIDYSTYEAFDNNPAFDKLVFGSDAATDSRSQKFLQFLRQDFDTSGKAILDFGCNRGAFLGALNDVRLKAGFDLNPNLTKIIREIGAEYYLPNRPPPPATYDLVSMIHVCEHLTNFDEQMGTATRSLTDSGLIAIAVPNAEVSLIDFYIQDHCHHFGRLSIKNIFGNIGFHLASLDPHCIEGEIFAIFEYNAKKHHNTSTLEPFRVNDLKMILAKYDAYLCEISALDVDFIIYGAGNVGALLGSSLGGRLICYVDDDSRKWQKKFNGKDICSPDILSDFKGVVLDALPRNHLGKAEKFFRCLDV